MPGEDDSEVFLSELHDFDFRHVECQWLYFDMDPQTGGVVLP